MNAKDWYTPNELATLIGVSPNKVLGWIHRKELRAINVGAGATDQPRWRISAADFERFAKARESAPAPRLPRRRVEDVIEFFKAPGGA